MAKHALIKDGKIENIIALEEGNYTTTYIVNDRGDKLPTFTNEKGETVISTTKWLVPEGCTVELYTRGEVGDSWPVADPETKPEALAEVTKKTKK